MPEMTIQLRCDPATGRRDVIVKLHGDADLLPHEHETLHRKLVDQLIEGGVIKAGEAGRLIVEREEGVVIAPPTAGKDEPVRKSVAAGE
ncbi:MAG: hypothetical protein K1X57_17550 [Gemmataceae bacterium]|nr:hypothetical protein [Gemmataceae bacterium]